MPRADNPFTTTIPVGVDDFVGVGVGVGADVAAWFALATLASSLGLLTHPLTNNVAATSATEIAASRKLDWA
jgi:hypothetical protein